MRQTKQPKSSRAENPLALLEDFLKSKEPTWHTELEDGNSYELLSVGILTEWLGYISRYKDHIDHVDVDPNIISVFNRWRTDKSGPFDVDIDLRAPDSFERIYTLLKQ